MWAEWPPEPERKERWEGEETPKIRGWGNTAATLLPLNASCKCHSLKCDRNQPPLYLSLWFNDLHFISLSFQLVERHYAYKYICMDISIKPLCCSQNNLHILYSFNNAGLLSTVGWAGGGTWGIFLYYQTTPTVWNINKTKGKYVF